MPILLNEIAASKAWRLFKKKKLINWFHGSLKIIVRHDKKDNAKMIVWIEFY